MMMFEPGYFLRSEGIMLAIFALFTVILLFYYSFYFLRIAFFKPLKKTEESKLPPISVIICAKNEYENLSENLPLILEQDYPDFEVVLVNDFSQDDSYFLLKSLEERYKHFKVVHLRENVNFFEGKKLALAVGIKSSKHDIVLLTDADCKPSGKNWIHGMARPFTNGTDIVLGYGGYEKRPGFLNNLIRFDTVNVALQYMTYALAGKPYMGVGRNLAYRKALFFKEGGFASHYKIKSGDDDLFVNKAANKHNTRICIDSETITWSKPKLSFGAWFNQKKRHLSTGRYYKKRDKFKLGLFATSSLFFYLSFVGFLFFAQSSLSLLIAAGLFVVKTILMVIVYYFAGKRFMDKKLYLFSPVFDLIIVFLNPLFALSNLFYKKNKWK